MVKGRFLWGAEKGKIYKLVFLCLISSFLRSCFIISDLEEHFYEEVDTESHMQTIDIKLSHRDMKRGVEDFFNNETKAVSSDCDYKDENSEEAKTEVAEKVNIFRKKLLNRISKLINK